MKRPDTTPCGESAPAKQKARQLVWPRHHRCVVVEFVLEPAATAPAASTPAVINIVVVVAVAPAAPPAPAAAAPGVSVSAKTPEENAAIINPKTSFFILAPLNDENTKNLWSVVIMLGKNLEWQVF